jgi:CspA family cold shock protein
MSISGTVKMFNNTRGYGFCTRDDGGEDVFVHGTAVDAAGLAGLSVGDRVIMKVDRGPRGPRATTIALAA